MAAPEAAAVNFITVWWAQRAAIGRLLILNRCVVKNALGLKETLSCQSPPRMLTAALLSAF